MATPHCSSSQVLTALENGPFRKPAHAWLYEVSNGTGYSRQKRSADALVVSCWPSRGIWVAGIEVKVSRSDWKRELDQPEKAAEIQKWCDFWWIAAPDGVVDLGEVPEKWGFIQTPTSKGKCKTLRDAPRLKPQPFDRPFIASILRNQAEQQNAHWMRGRDAAHQEAKEKYDVEAFTKLRGECAEANTKANQLDRSLEYANSNLSRLRETVQAFEHAAGLPQDTIGNRGTTSWDCRHEAGEHYKAALLLKNAANLEERFREVADALAALRAETRESA